WGAVFAGVGGRVVDLPTYPFQRRHHWAPQTDGATSPVLVDDQAEPELAPEVGAPGLHAELLTLSDAEQLNRLLTVVRASTAVVLGLDSAEAVDPERTFKEQGFESITAVELCNHLRLGTGKRVPTTLVYSHPTPLAAARHLRDEILGRSTTQDNHLPAARTAVVDDDPVVIVGMGCRLPGG
ncbi:acyl carrier protein, partial [Micromonospora sp. LOL_013]|uniref:acyl carrier protein n=1 Tax=Micromonospora sp. LOL_013 TaxID=3345414 RepID=UPI003A85525B